MRRIFIVLTFLILFISVLFLRALPACAAEYKYDHSYNYYVELAEDAFYEADYINALFHFETAHNIKPDEKRPLKYIRLIKRLREGQVETIEGYPEESTPTYSKTRTVFKEAPSEKRKKTLKPRLSYSKETTPSVIKPIQKTEEKAQPISARKYYERPETSMATASSESEESASLESLEEKEAALADTGIREEEISEMTGRPSSFPSGEMDQEENPLLDLSAQEEEEEEFVWSQESGPSPEDFFDEETISRLDEVIGTGTTVQVEPETKIASVKIPEDEISQFQEEVSQQRKTVETAPQIVKATSSSPTPVQLAKTSSKARESTTRVKATSQEETAPVKNLRSPKEDKDQRIILFDDDLWGMQPNTTIEIELDKSVILRGNNIQRHLMITEGFFDVTTIDRDNIEITCNMIGTSLFHVWDDQKRWTFNLKGILPLYLSEMTRKSFERLEEQLTDPFVFFYSNTWGSSYSGNKFSDMSRRNLTFSQTAGITGETPYGAVDASANFYRFDKSTDIVGQTIGLTNGNIGPFKDFSIRGFDATKYLSTLSFPGRNFRGFRFDAYAFNRNINYSIFHGKDRATFAFLSPSSFDERDVFVQGGELTLFPDEDNSYSFNYARGYGEDHESYLSDRVFSVEAENKIGDFQINSEIAYDEDEFAKLVYANYRKDNHILRITLRDLEPDFTSAVGTPSNRGEAGGIVSYDTRLGKYSLGGSLEMYRNREYFNPSKKDELNYDTDISVGYQINSLSSLRATAAYANTPQLLNPQETIRLSSRFTQIIRLFEERNLSFFFGQSLQRNRFDKSPTSEYDRYTLDTGFRLPLFKRLSYFLNYQYTWVEAISNNEKSRPKVLTTGLNYGRDFGRKLSTNIGFTYRDEETTEGSFSFLSGEDSIRGTIGLTYRPTTDIEIFCDGSIRNVWTENPDNSAFNEADIRLGLRSDWNLPFRWNPSGIVRGIVFKDINGDNVRNSEEPGIEGIILKIGKDREVITNDIGEYWLEVKAKKVLVSLDINSLPKGYLASNGFTEEVTIEHLGTKTVNFGLTTRSGIYGVIYYDKNKNGRYDVEDSLIPGVKVVLDTENNVYSDYDGGYEFDNITPGKHIIAVDLNTIPMEYIPMIRLKNEVDVSEGTTYIFHVPLKKK